VTADERADGKCEIGIMERFKIVESDLREDDSGIPEDSSKIPVLGRAAAARPVTKWTP
jgi:hypothetical protein